MLKARFQQNHEHDVGCETMRALVATLCMIAGVAREFTSTPVHAFTQTNGKIIEPNRLVKFVEELP